MAAKNPIKAENLPSKEELKEDVKAASKSSLQSLRALAAGGVGGICAVVVGHPFDLVKVRLQTAEKGVYNGAMDVVRKTIAREGLARGLYAGVSAPLVGVTPMCKYPVVAESEPPSLTAMLTNPQSPSPSGATTSASNSSPPSPPSTTTNTPSPKSPRQASSAPSP